MLISKPLPPSHRVGLGYKTMGGRKDPLPGPEKTQILTRENTLEKKCIIMRFIYPFKRVLKHFFKI